MPNTNNLEGVRLSEEGLFHGISADARARLAAISRSRLFHPGDIIFNEGDVPDEICVFIEGHAILVSGREHSEKPLLVQAGEREIFGIAEAMGGSPYAFSLEAISPCRVDVISCCDLNDFLMSEDGPRLRLARFLSMAVQLRRKLAR